MKMTLEQHRAFGEQVRQFRETLMQPHILCVETKHSRECRAVEKALKAVDHLKNVMDSLVCRDFPECEDKTQIYYGMSAAWIARTQTKPEAA